MFVMGKGKQTPPIIDKSAMENLDCRSKEITEYVGIISSNLIKSEFIPVV